MPTTTKDAPNRLEMVESRIRVTAPIFENAYCPIPF